MAGPVSFEHLESYAAGLAEALTLPVDLGTPAWAKPSSATAEGHRDVQRCSRGEHREPEEEFPRNA